MIPVGCRVTKTFRCLLVPKSSRLVIITLLWEKAVAGFAPGGEDFWCASAVVEAKPGDLTLPAEARSRKHEAVG